MDILRTITMDEIVPCEIRHLQDLINAIFVDTVAHEVNKLRKEKCCGCLVDHPSKRRHDCVMMTEDEGWIEHGLEAIERAIEQETVWRKFLEAVRVLKLTLYKQARKHYNNLKNNHATTLNLLMDLKGGTSLSEHEPIVNYLFYWIHEH